MSTAKVSATITRKYARGEEREPGVSLEQWAFNEKGNNELHTLATLIITKLFEFYYWLPDDEIEKQLALFKEDVATFDMSNR
jgi:hypothetical protein